jgi:hypothetical protein
MGAPGRVPKVRSAAPSSGATFWQACTLESGRNRVHIDRVAEKHRTKLLEVSVIERGAQSWEWRVHTGDNVHVCGFELSRMAARFSGYDAMFQILADGKPKTP